MSQLEIPKGWKLKKIFELSSSYAGGTPSTSVSKYWEDGTVSWLRSGELKNNIISKSKQQITKKGLNESSAKLWPKNTALIAITGANVGNTSLLDFESSGNQSIVGILPSAEIIPKFMWYYLQFSYQYFRSKRSGGAQPHINGKIVSQREIIYPTLEIQTKIVKKLDYVLNKFEQIKKIIFKNDLLKNSQQIEKTTINAIITNSSSGLLTKNWREKNLKNTSINLDWRESKLDEIIQKKGIFDGPFGSNLKTEDYTDSGARLIRLQNIGKMEFIDSKKSYVSMNKFEKLKRHQIFPGDIIFASFVGIGPRTCIIPKLDTVAINKADCFCIRTDHDVILPEYLLLQLNSKKSHEQLSFFNHGLTRPRITTKQLRSLKIHLCSIDEQKEIVRLTKKQISETKIILDKLQLIDLKYKSIKNEFDSLFTSTLNQAFSGRLVN